MKLDLNDRTALRLVAECADAERCFHIYNNAASAERPAMAWALLPIGNDVVETLVKLLDLPIEHDTPPGMYRDHLEVLTARRDRAWAAWRSNFRTQELNIHVH